MSEKKLKNVFIDGPIISDFIANSIQKHSSKTDIGAHSIFLGQVRKDIINDKEVIGIQYTAYEEMANEQLHKFRESIFEKYDLTCMHIYHSLGMVNTGEICLFVFTSSKHRRSAIDACDEIIEYIKNETPIWGKEIFADATSQWKVNK